MICIVAFRISFWIDTVCGGLLCRDFAFFVVLPDRMKASEAEEEGVLSAENAENFRRAN
jgi:hypothetical protein